MLYLCAYIGTGTDDDPYRPVGSDQPGWSAIDLRPDPTVTDGWALVRTPEPFTAEGAIPIGELDEIPSVQGSRGIENRLGLERNTLRSKTLRNIIADLLILWGDEDSQTNGRWKKLVPAGGRLQVWLGELIYDMAVPAGGATYVDDFESYGDIELEEAANWSKVSGRIFVRTADTSRRAQTLDASEYRFELETDTEDMSCTLNVVQFGRGRLGAVARMSGTERTFYLFRWFSGAFEIYKTVDASFSLLGSFTETKPDVPFDITGECDGSSLRLLLDGVEKVSVTDTAITGHKRSGIRGEGTTLPVEDRNMIDVFTAADLAAAGPVGPFLRTTGGYIRTPNGILRPA